MNWTFAEYSVFKVGPESDRFRLSVSGYSGNADNALMSGFSQYLISNNCTFSTPDNDTTQGGCASQSPGGWWFNGCSCSQLNILSPGIWIVGIDNWDVVASRMMMRCA